jgi:flagellar biogenesis protein FliO
VCAFAFALLVTFASDAGAAPATQPGSGRSRADKKPAAALAPATQAAAVLPPPPAKPSVLDAEPIRRRGAAPATAPAGGAGAATRPAGAAAATSPAPQAFEFRRVVLALGAVIALIFFLRWIAKRVFVMPGGARASRAVQVLTRSPLAPRQQVLLLQVGRRVVVVADSGGTMSTLCQIDDPDEVTSLLAQIMAERGMASPKAFGSVFGRTRNRFDATMDEGNGDGETEGEGDHISSALAGADGGIAPDGPAVDETRSEIRNLMDKVRQMSSQFRASRGESGT